MQTPSCRSKVLCLVYGTESPQNETLFCLLPAISLNMAVKKISTKPIDPSNFLCALKHKLSIIRVVPSDLNTQQDVAEILQVILDELKHISMATSHFICNTKNHSFW